ncbi:MAG: hypothetical protein E6G22_15320 [Actinobacteria bacterium]|nr:MAG: hypothetical protein E6G22_15320 [Actinomycetota bacterium]
MFRRRRETLNEKLLREAGLERADVGAEPPAPLVPEPKHPGPPHFGVPHAFEQVTVTGLQRFREWDATATTEAPGLEGDEVSFVALPDGSLVVDEEVGDQPLSPLADAIEEQLRPPYRARGVRRHGDVWAVAANTIEVVDLGPEVEGEEIELVSQAGERTLTVDGARTFGGVPRLERLAESRSADYVVHASRIDGNLWEVRIDAL